VDRLAYRCRGRSDAKQTFRPATADDAGVLAELARDVVGSLQYVRRREDLREMKVGLFSRCCGANATMIAMTKHPEYFKDIRCMVAPAMPYSSSKGPEDERILQNRLQNGDRHWLHVIDGTSEISLG
jgi:hypothetical protein